MLSAACEQLTAISANQEGAFLGRSFRELPSSLPYLPTFPSSAITLSLACSPRQHVMSSFFLLSSLSCFSSHVKHPPGGAPCPAAKPALRASTPSATIG